MDNYSTISNAYTPTYQDAGYQFYGQSSTAGLQGEDGTAKAQAANLPGPKKTEATDAPEKKPVSPGEQVGADGVELSDEAKRRLQELKATDTKVRQHEQAHLAAAGGYAISGANFQYSTGPDGQRYATGGEVEIDIAVIPDDPDATIRKMQVIRRAALAPADPSAQDRRVAARASQLESEARQQSTAAQIDSAFGTGNSTEKTETPYNGPQSTNSGENESKPVPATYKPPTQAYQFNGMPASVSQTGAGALNFLI